MFKKGFLSWFKNKPKSQQQAEEQARLEAEAKAQAEEQARLEAEAQAKAQAEEQARLKVEAQAKAQAEEQARLEAEAQAKAQAEEQARLEAEAQAKAQAEEQARLKAEAQAKAQAEEQARLEAEAQAKAKAQAEEQARLEAEAQAKAQAEEQARLEAEAQAKAKAQAEEQARLEAELEKSKQTEIAEEEEEAKVVSHAKPGLFHRLKQGLKRTRMQISDGFLNLFKGKKIDDDLFEEIEEQLLIADVGIETTEKLMQHLIEQATRQQLKDSEVLFQILQDKMQSMLDEVEAPLTFSSNTSPQVVLMVGVNGVGKTTTIGKLAKKFQQEGRSVMLAAGDTFRAAAVEQLQVWGDRNQIPVIAQPTGADSASVIYDAFESAKARGIDILIADTAGRLQNKAHLMEELKKIVRVMKKIDPQAPHEIMLTLDAGTGQNAINQAKLFHEAVGLTGITLSKLDGTAKGGIIFSIADQFKLPIRYIGVGEQLDDLQVFHAQSFIKALFNPNQ